MRYPALFGVLGVLVLTCGCGGGGGSADGEAQTEGGAAADLGLEAVWLINRDLHTLTKVDLATNEDLARIEMPGPPIHLAAGAGALWVAIEEGSILRVDPATEAIVATVDPGGRPSGLAAEGSMIWATHDGLASSDAPPELVRIDPSTNAITARVRVADVNESYSDVVVNGGHVWVLISNGFGVARIDGATDTLGEDLRLGAGGGYGYGEIAVTSGAVYVIDEYSNVLHTLAPAPLTPRSETEIPENWAGWWAADDRALYFAHVDEERILVLDPASASVQREIPLDSRVRALRLLRNRLVVALRDGDLLVIDPVSARTLASLPGNWADGVAVE